MREKIRMFSDIAIDTAVAVGSMLSGKGKAYWARLDEVEEVVEDSNAKSSAGCYRKAFIFENFVVKVSKTKDRTKELKAEADFINKMKADPKFGRHFPDTLCIEVNGVCVQVQEKVDMNHRGAGRNGWRIEDAVENLAFKLGIEDCHIGNYGWKGPKGKEYPVFIDVDFRTSQNSSKPKERSWMV
jgi:hypothetical protein